MPEGDVRLNRFLAAAGLGTRRSVERLIASGRIAVNGEEAREPARRVATSDRVTLDGGPIEPRGASGVLVRLVRGRVPRVPHAAELHLAGVDEEAGTAVLLSDAHLAQRLRANGYDPGRLDDHGLRPGGLRPLSPAELEAARVYARR